MELLSTYSAKYADSKKDSDVARHNVLSMLQAVGKLYEKIEKVIKHKDSIDAFLDACIAKTPPILKDYYALAEKAEKLKESLDAAEHEEKKKMERAAKREAKSAQKQPQIVNNYIVYGNLQQGGQSDTHVGNPEPAKRGPIKQLKEEDPQPIDIVAKKYKKASIPKSIKDDIWDYYIGNDCARTACPCCQRKEIRMNDFVAGHVLAERHGGQAIRENLIPICNTCNSSMGSTHMIEFCEKYWRRGVVLAKNNTFSRQLGKRAGCERHDHCLLIKGGEVDKGKFDTEEEALVYARSKKYTVISHKTDSKAMYYFKDKPVEKINGASDPLHGDWAFTSWSITYD